MNTRNTLFFSLAGYDVCAGFLRWCNTNTCMIVCVHAHVVQLILHVTVTITTATATTASYYHSYNDSNRTASPYLDKSTSSTPVMPEKIPAASLVNNEPDKVTFAVHLLASHVKPGALRRVQLPPSASA